MTVTRTLFLKLAVALLLSPFPAKAADWQPPGQQTMIVAAAAGGGFDVLARAMARQWEKYFGVKLIVQNQGAAGGSLAMDRVATSKPDGLTLGLMSRAPYLGEQITKTFTWNIADLQIPVAAVTPPYALVTGAKSPYQTWDDVRKSKTKVRIATANQIAGEVVFIRDLLNSGREVTTANMNANGIIAALQANDVDIWASVASVVILDPIKGGQLRPLVTFDDKRYKQLPDTPTHVELGMPVNYKDINSSRIFFVPLGTSQAIVDGVAARMTRLLNDPEIKGWAEENGLVDAILTGPAAKASQDGLYKLMKENDDIVKTYGG
jgi:tripartite-type tricarboxylate transporter receptor subunit TctC